MDDKIQWFNENEGRKYPLSETASGVDDTGQIVPSDILVDAGIMVPSDYADVRLHSLVVTTDIITLALTSATSALMVGTFARSAVEPYKAYPLTPVVNNVSGWVVFGTHRTVVEERYKFSTAAQAQLEQRAVRVVDNLAVTLCRKFGGQASRTVGKVVTLNAGVGITIQQDTVDPQKIVIGLKESVASSFISPCDNPANEDRCGVAPLKSILGVCADVNGRVTLRLE